MIDKLNEHYSFCCSASVYDEEAMTALELAGRTTHKVNECVDKINDIDNRNEQAIDYMKDNIVTTTEKVVSEKVRDGEIIVDMEYNADNEALVINAVPHAGGSGYKYIPSQELIDLL